MNQRTPGKIIAHLARLALGIVFLVAGLLKAADIGLFVEQIQDYRMVPVALTPFMARFLVILELGLAAGLLVGWRPRITSAIGAGLLLVFMAAIGWSWANGYTGPCGCFGSRGLASGPGAALIEDTLFLALAVIAYVGLRRHAGGRSGWQRAAVIAGAVLGVVLPPIATHLPIDGVVTDARAGVAFDHLVVEGFDGDIQKGEYLFALLDPQGRSSVAAVEPLNELADAADLPHVVGISQGSNDELVAFILEHSAFFDMGHAPRAALRRFYRELPVFVKVENGMIEAAWFGAPPGADELRAGGSSS